MGVVIMKTTQNNLDIVLGYCDSCGNFSTLHNIGNLLCDACAGYVLDDMARQSGGGI